MRAFPPLDPMQVRLVVLHEEDVAGHAVLGPGLAGQVIEKLRASEMLL